MISQSDLAKFGKAKNTEQNCTLEQAEAVAALLKSVGIEGAVKIQLTQAPGPHVMPIVGVDEVEGGVDVKEPYQYVLILSSPKPEDKEAPPYSTRLAATYNLLVAKDPVGQHTTSPYDAAMQVWASVSNGAPWNPLDIPAVKLQIVEDVNDSWVEPVA